MLEIVGLIVGLVIGIFFPWTIPSQWTLYVATGLLAALDSALGGFRAFRMGQQPLHSGVSARQGIRHGLGNGDIRLQRLHAPSGVGVQQGAPGRCIWRRHQSGCRSWAEKSH